VKPALPSRTPPRFRPERPSALGRVLRAGITLFLVLLAGGVIAAPAQAAAYRYWGYFQLTNGAWAFAQTGPAQAVPKDGSIEGWRFAVADESSTRAPRATPTFETLCASTPVTTGNKRVGLVIDYGRPADAAEATPAPPAPRATCVAVPAKATGSDVLVAAEATLRLDPKGLTCAIDGWPAAGCGGQVDPVSAAAASPDTSVTIAAPPSASATPLAKSADTSADTGSSVRGPILAGLAALVAVGALGFGAWRRGRDITED